MTRAVSLTGLSRSFPGKNGGVSAVRGLELDVEAGSLLTLLGPSGCGKSTTLRMIAGLERPDAGRIQIGSRILFDANAGIDVPANRRGIGMVFQSLALWPHLSVAGNIGYPLRVAGVPRRARVGRVEELLRLVDLDGYAGRHPATLSGGQQQRVAIARALAHEPNLLLLDEPFSALDARLRRQLGEELKEIQRRLGVTIVYVTHDRHEALLLSDAIGIMSNGRLLQVGTPREVYWRPIDATAAQLLGAVNVVRGTVTAIDARGTLEVTTPFGVIPGGTAAWRPSPGTPVDLLLRPESLRVLNEVVAGEQPSGALALPATVSGVAFRGASESVDVEVNGSRLTGRAADGVGLAPGMAVTLLLDPRNRIVVPAASSRV